MPEFVHHGVGMLMLSILLGISTILYFFRGRLNFEAGNNIPRLLVYAWIIQNLAMVASTAFRNHLYITEALLTYKRIGVYFWLLMAVAGLLTTAVKLSKIRPAWYLFSANSLIAYVILVLSAGLDWDRFITTYNMQRVKYTASLDKKYLVSLSETNMAQLYSIKNDPEFNTDSLYHYEYRQGYVNSRGLDVKLYEYLKHIAQEDWRSYNLRKKRILQEVAALNSAGKITSLDLSNNLYQTLRPVFVISNITDLNAGGCRIDTVSQLSHFKKLQKLDISDNHLLSIDELPALKYLTHLNIGSNSISGLSSLARVPALQVLDISNNNLTGISDLPALPRLNQLSLDGNKISDLSYLEKYPALAQLSLNDYHAYPEQVPELKSLRSLSLSGSPDLMVIMSTKPPEGLTFLDLSHNVLKSADLLLLAEKDKAPATVKFQYLKELYLNDNELNALNALRYYIQLKTLDLSGNKIISANVLSALKHLQILNINNNYLLDLSFIDSLPALRELNVSNNERAKNFTCLKRLAALTRLDVSGTGFNDLSVIASPQLAYLNLKDCNISSLKPLETMKSLETLFVSRLKQEDIAIIEKMTHLKKVYVSQTSPSLVLQLQNKMRHALVEYDN